MKAPDQDILLAHVLQISRSSLQARKITDLSEDQKQRLQDLVARRLKGEPVAYLIGEKEFWSLPLKVTPDVLIPRPDTETLVEACLELFPLPLSQACAPLPLAGEVATKSRVRVEIADLGTGSGAIALALAKERSDWNMTATDFSERALDVAKENAKRLGLTHVKFLLGSWCEALPYKAYDVIVSNPPYIAEDDILLKGDGVCSEPKTALVAANNGYQALFSIIESARSYLKKGGWLLLEHGYTQQQTLIQFMQEKGYQNVKGLPDLAGQPRVVMGQNCKVL